MSEKKGVFHFLGRAGRRIAALCRGFIYVTVLVLVVGLIVIAMRDDTPKVPKTAALVVAPNGSIVEQLAGDPMDKVIAKLQGRDAPETLLKDLVDAIEAAAGDDRVQVLLLDLNQVGSAWTSKLQDLGKALRTFKESGKPIIATSDAYTQNSYYLAAHADEVYLHHMGMVLLEGYGRYRRYYKEGLDKFGVEYHVFRVGEFKSAMEPFLRDDMSPQAREANLEWLGDLWGAYLEDVAAARGIAVEALQDYAESIDRLIEAAAGDTAKAALDAGLIDHAGGRDQVRDRLIELVGEDEDTHSFHKIGFGSYLEALGEDRFGEEAKGDVVGVVVARGTILTGSQPPGKIGGDSTAKLIRQARNDDKVKALVLRVDSGGGSALASEIIRRELALAREDGKPVVVSMGSVAASGGYWVSMASDEVWASPTTITGSIGIFGAFPTFEKPLAKYLGVHVDGVGTTRLAGAFRADRALDPEVGKIIQTIIEEGYRNFLQTVASSRGMSPEEVDEIARGRVWSGMDAHELGLVDQLGGLEDAIASAASLAELDDDYGVKYIKKEIEFKDKILRNFLTSVGNAVASDRAPDFVQAPFQQLVRSLVRQEEIYSELNDPYGMYAWCPECDLQ